MKSMERYSMKVPGKQERCIICGQVTDIEKDLLQCESIMWRGPVSFAESVILKFIPMEISSKGQEFCRFRR